MRLLCHLRAQLDKVFESHLPAINSAFSPKNKMLRGIDHSPMGLPNFNCRVKELYFPLVSLMERMSKLPSRLVCAGLASVIVVAGSAGAQTGPVITHGIAAGDVTSVSAVVWARSDRPATMRVRAEPLTGSGPGVEALTETTEDRHLTAQTTLTPLAPDTRYRYQIWFEADGISGTAEAGTFRTAPMADVRAAVSLIWSGDLAGQGYCRRADDGFPIFEPMRALDADVFVANGDMIYADSVCPPRGPGWVNVPGGFPGIADPAVDWEDPAAVDEVYAAHWRYNRTDPAFQDFLRTTPMYVQWDDHEVINDFGAAWPALAAARRGAETAAARGGAGAEAAALIEAGGAGPAGTKGAAANDGTNGLAVTAEAGSGAAFQEW